MQWCTHFSKIYMTPQNSSHQKSDTKKIPYCGSKYTRPHGTKFRLPGDLAHGIYGSLSIKKNLLSTELTVCVYHELYHKKIFHFAQRVQFYVPRDCIRTNRYCFAIQQYNVRTVFIVRRDECLNVFKMTRLRVKRHTTKCSGAQIFQKSTRHLKILVIRRVT